jgi:hypothetical protein
MVGSLANTELEWILKERIVDQFKVNTWRDQERHRKLVKTASLRAKLEAMTSEYGGRSL